MIRERTDWMGVAFGIALACLVAFQQFKLPPVLPVLLADYNWDRTLAGGLMAIYALAGLLISVPIARPPPPPPPLPPPAAPPPPPPRGHLPTGALPPPGWFAPPAPGAAGIALSPGPPP